MSDPNQTSRKEVLTAGYDDATECTFEDGELLSRTREVPVRSGSLGGFIIDSTVGSFTSERVARPRCPLIFRCDSCPKKRSIDGGSDKSLPQMDPDQLANAQQLHGTIHGFS